MEQFALQLDLFREETPLTFMSQRIGCIEIKVENARKGLFARFNELAKKYVEVRMRCETMEVEIAQLREMVKALDKKVIAN